MWLGFVVIVGTVLFMAGLGIVLHRLNTRYGLIPVVSYVVMLAAIVQVLSTFVIYLQLHPELRLFLIDVMLVPPLLMSLLIIYVVNGTFITRVTIFSVIVAALSVMVIMQISRLYLSLSLDTSLSQLSPESPILQLNPPNVVASFFVFVIDMYIMVIIYQASANHLPHLSHGLTIGLALLCALWGDTLLYNALFDLLNHRPFSLPVMDLLGKMIAWVVIWPLAAAYLMRIQRTAAKRPTFDVLVNRLMADASLYPVSSPQQANLYQQLVENIQEVFWLRDRSGKDVYISPAFETIWGISSDNLNEERLLQTIHPDDREYMRTGLKRELNEETQLDYRIIRPDGKIRWISSQSYPLRGRSGGIYATVGIAQDVTNKHESLQRQQQLIAEQERVRVLREFIGDVSHDLKTPLSIIITRLYLLKHKYALSEGQPHLETIETQVLRVSRLIDNMLTLSRLDSVHNLYCEPLHLKNLLEAIHMQLNPMAEQRRITLSLSPPEESFKVYVNPAEMERVLTNLVENALFYTEPGGQVNISAKRQDHKVQITVQDTGIGIPADKLPHIFERFYRVDEMRRTDKGGSGLGLAIAKKVVEVHGGEIKVSSVLGQGTTFTVWLPLAADETP